MRVNNLSKVSHDSAAAAIEPATSSHKSNDHYATEPKLWSQITLDYDCFNKT